MKTQVLPLTGVCLWLLVSQAVLASGIRLPVEHPELRPVGSGSLTWWGVTLYQATLLAPGGEYRPDGLHALEIVYRYDFSREQLARATLKEIERMQGERPDREALIARFTELFTDVLAGERLTGVYLPGQGADFYGPSGHVGHLRDARLAADFFQIWLHPHTLEPDLRRQLLGARE